MTPRSKGQPQLPKDIKAVRHVYRATQEFVEQLRADLAEAVSEAKLRRLGAARHMESVHRFLRQRETEAGGSATAGLASSAPTGVSIGADLAIGLKQLDGAALADAATQWSEAIAALAAFEGKPFERKPVSVGRRRKHGGREVAAKTTAEDAALAALETAGARLLELLLAVAQRFEHRVVFEQRVVAGRKRRSSATPVAAKWLTPPQVAEQLGVSPDKVRGWIRSGNLKATNTAGSGSQRPRWRISEQALAEFEESRRPMKAARPAKRRTRRKDPAVNKYF